MTTATIHSFGERLEWSEKLSDEPSWLAFYKKLWPSMVSATRFDSKCWHQTHGIDRLVVLENGRQFTIDEKKREKDFGDILLEVWSVAQYDPATKRIVQGEKPGWSVDPQKRCDFVVYAILPTEKAYLLPFELLRQTVHAFLGQWRQDPWKWPKAAKNNGYWTINVAVTWPELHHCMAVTMQRQFGEHLSLPCDSKVSSAQREFSGLAVNE